NAFFDYARVYSVTNKPVGNLRSTGGEIFFDTKWWNQQPVSFGFRISYLLDDGFDGEKKGSTLFEFILPLDLIPD
ncbi:MAG TPA: hypothetical protein VFZ78_13185, partial [Flavisolibacter sp.]